MNDSAALTRQISSLWRLHTRRQSLYQVAMNLDISSHLRRICSRGNMSSLLFRREIHSIYDSLKCYTTDGELDSITRMEDDDLFNETNVLDSLLVTIRDNHQQTIIQYRKILKDADLDAHTTDLFHDHVDKLEELNQLLNMELKKHEDQSQNYFTAVA